METPGATTRLRVDFAYDGTDFSGWAAQPGLRTVEETLAEAWRTILRTSQTPRLTVAGRTDAGVHARGAVCHLDVGDAELSRLPGRSDRPPTQAAVTRLNGVLPGDLVVRAVRVAPGGFDARFSAMERRYRYRLLDDPSRLDPLRRRDTTVVRRPLDLARMQDACAELVGLHDFGAFCKQREGATTIRTLLEYSWRREDDGVLVATVRADAFCHSMVRALIGGAVPVGEGRRDAAWLHGVLIGARRDPGVAVMPPQGLSLEEVVYPPDEELAARAAAARSVRTLPGADQPRDA
ncbi:tRNA pseudouridine synthase A [Arsenicicoccus dermatophilus]|uniref:tRNA pseudouridine synthase A n=1 Tax=Arsenicicoccus dermatophilus TaxID=1076331 RepID=UPI001F4C7229|nr:tRNA pseudouridine synthase A [Arsenicicoccus dermatophilus]MCH8613752.1 tRNA pseudouridine synthase A [Arsenicicoccus dermatophilus]